MRCLLAVVAFTTLLWLDCSPFLEVVSGGLLKEGKPNGSAVAAQAYLPRTAGVSEDKSFRRGTGTNAKAKIRSSVYGVMRRSMRANNIGHYQWWWAPLTAAVFIIFARAMQVRCSEYFSKQRASKSLRRNLRRLAEGGLELSELCEVTGAEADFYSISEEEGFKGINEQGSLQGNIEQEDSQGKNGRDVFLDVAEEHTQLGHHQSNRMGGLLENNKFRIVGAVAVAVIVILFSLLLHRVIHCGSDVTTAPPKETQTTTSPDTTAPVAPSGRAPRSGIPSLNLKIKLSRPFNAAHVEAFLTGMSEAMVENFQEKQASPAYIRAAVDKWAEEVTSQPNLPLFNLRILITADTESINKDVRRLTVPADKLSRFRNDRASSKRGIYTTTVIMDYLQE